MSPHIWRHGLLFLIATYYLRSFPGPYFQDILQLRTVALVEHKEPSDAGESIGYDAAGGIIPSRGSLAAAIRWKDSSPLYMEILLQSTR